MPTDTLYADTPIPGGCGDPNCEICYQMDEIGDRASDLEGFRRPLDYKTPVVEKFINEVVAEQGTPETYYRIGTLDPAMTTLLPDHLQGRFEYMGQLLAAVYMEGMRFAESTRVSADYVDRYENHMCHQLSVEVEVETVPAPLVTTTTIL